VCVVCVNVCVCVRVCVCVCVLSGKCRRTRVNACAQVSDAFLLLHFEIGSKVT